MNLEKMSSDYLFFRFPVHYVLILGPVIIGVTNFFINPVNVDTFNRLSPRDALLDNHYDSIFLYLNISKLALAIMYAFFITYRWTVINKNGSYGYYLTQGLERDQFFILSSLVFLLDGFLGITIGLILINFGGGINLSLLMFLKILFLVFSSTILLLSVSIFLGEILNQPELSSFILVLIFGLNALLINDRSSIWFKILKSDLLFADNNILLPFIYSFLLGSAIIMITFKIHLRQDVEI
jgi:hypothetical protein